MLKNYIKIAWRSLKRQPFFTFLNLFGLAIGIAGSILIGLFIYDELSYDTMFPDKDRIYRLNADIKFGGEQSAIGEVSAPMAAAILHDIPQVEQTMRLRNIYSGLIREKGADHNIKESSVAYADSTFFDMLGVKLMYGDVRTALTEPNTIVMTRSAAEKHFPIAEALGRTVVLNDSETYTVTGIMEDLPKNSLLRDHHMFLAMSGLSDSREGGWGSHNYYTLIKLRPGATEAQIAPALNRMVEDYMIPYVQKYFPGITMESLKASGNYVKYSATALPDIHLYSHRNSEISSNGDIRQVYILGAVGIFMLVLACVNFMNLSTAFSLKRAKEVGIRKTLGSARMGLIRQFLTESELIAFGAMILGLFLAMALLPFFNGLAHTALSIPFTNPLFWSILILVALGLGLLAGSYPAFFMSRFVPAKVLKGQGDKQIGGGRIRNILVVFQFAVSIVLLVGTLVVYQQLQFMTGRDQGYNMQQVLVVQNMNMLNGKQQALKDEIGRLGSVEKVTISGFLPTPSARNDNTYLQADDPSQEKAVQMQEWGVDKDYIATLDLKLVAGRNFDPMERPADSTALILNEEAVRQMGISPEQVLGKRMIRNVDTGDTGTVIGVVKDFNYESLRNKIRALALYMGRGGDNLVVKLKPGQIGGTMAQVEALWHEIAPEQPFEYHFLDDAFNNVYDMEQRLGRIFMTFTILSILIACLGLFGLAAFNAEKRVKEIGVRKVLGATVGQITFRLSLDFLRLVGLAILIALPLGWWAMDRWLEDFNYRIDVPWWALVLAAVLAIAIALCTVSYQSIKAALTNPAKSLKTE